MTTRLTTELEGHVYSSCCKSGHLYDIPVWTYGNHGPTLFETDKPEVHQKAFIDAYLDQMAKLESTIQLLSKSENFNYTKEYILRASDEPMVTYKNAPYAIWNEKHMEEIKRSKQVLQEKVSEDQTNNFIKCVKCKSSEVDTEQKQTRSADEPMTIFCLCRKCGTRFTMS